MKRPLHCALRFLIPAAFYTFGSLLGAVRCVAASPQDLIAQMLPPEIVWPHAQSLALTAEQVAELKSGYDTLQLEMAPLQERMRASTAALVELLSQPKPDEKAVLSQFADLEQIESRLKIVRLKMTLVSKSVLTPEQQEKAYGIKETKAASAGTAGGENTIRTKLYRVKTGLERWRTEGRDTTEVRALWDKFQRHAEKREHRQAMAALDDALRILEATKTPKP